MRFKENIYYYVYEISRFQYQSTDYEATIKTHIDLVHLYPNRCEASILFKLCV